MSPAADFRVDNDSAFMSPESILYMIVCVILPNPYSTPSPDFADPSANRHSEKMKSVKDK